MTGLFSRIQHQPPTSTMAPAPPSVAPPVPQAPIALGLTAHIVGEVVEISPAELARRARHRPVRQQIVEEVIAALQGDRYLMRQPDTEATVRDLFDKLYPRFGNQLPAEEQPIVLEEVVNEVLGFGPIEPLLQDDTISDVLVNGPNQVYVERKGKVFATDVQFDDDAHVMRVIDRIITPLGRHIDEKWPMVDARLPDGSRVNAIIPPCAIDGPSVSIRKFMKKKLTVDDLIDLGSMTPQMSEFLRACVISRLNIIVSGGTGSGKTTLLNVVSSFIPADERIVTVEDSAELQLHQPHVVRLEAKPPERDGSGQVAIRDLVVNALRMRPERIIVGECRRGEALDMLQAMNTGHDGSLTTLHANNPRDTTRRLETMVLMAGMDLPPRAIREQIASAIDLIVHVARLRDGSRKIVQITEIQGMEGEVIVLTDVYVYQIQGIDKEGRVIGQMRPTGIRPKFTEKLETSGFKLPPEVFGLSLGDGSRGR
jgi:pilus assembly protein CpaF